MLNPGGPVIVYHLPNRLSYIEAFSRLIYGRKYGHCAESVKFHKYLFSSAEVRALASAAGLTVVDGRRYGFLPRNSFNRLPERLRSSRAVASIVNVADSALERLLAPFCQNHCFVGLGKES